MKNYCCKLSELPLMTEAAIIRVGTDSALTRRMAQLGIARGERITPVFKSPFGDPVAYNIKGCVVALRKADCKTIEVGVEVK